MMLAIALVIMLLTEVSSNTATIQVMLLILVAALVMGLCSMLAGRFAGAPP